MLQQKADPKNATDSPTRICATPGVPGFNPFGVPERLCGRTGASHPLPDGGLKSCMASKKAKWDEGNPVGMYVFAWTIT